MNKPISTLLLLFTVFLFGSGFDMDTAREANKAYESNNFERAITLYQQAIDQQPDNPRLYFNLGNAYAKAGRVNDALGAYEQYKALSEDPQDAYKADYNMGRVLSDAQQYDKALQYYKQALKHHPDDPEAKYNYELALKKKNEQQKQQQQQNQNSDQNKKDQDQQQDQQNQDQNQNQNQNQQNQNQQQNSQQQQENQQQKNSDQQQQPPQDQQQRTQQQKLNKQEAQQILNALEKKEKDLLKRFKKVKAESDKPNANDW
ncbi:MAG: tetratricopeptide repeat protein [Bacteroidota bacterium]